MFKGTLTLDYALPKLRELFERLESVEIAILFGSIAREGLSPTTWTWP
jgi:predicted nucleotidyltransferase